jgi:hypothetical protein
MSGLDDLPTLGEIEARRIRPAMVCRDCDWRAHGDAGFIACKAVQHIGRFPGHRVVHYDDTRAVIDSERAPREVRDSPPTTTPEPAPARYTLTAVLDEYTCDACRSAHGKEYATFHDALSHHACQCTNPNGCRCKVAGEVRSDD